MAVTPRRAWLAVGEQPQSVQTDTRWSAVLNRLVDGWSAHGLTVSLVAARFLLKPCRKYEQSVKAFEPYDAIKEEHPEAGLRAGR